MVRTVSLKNLAVSLVLLLSFRRIGCSKFEDIDHRTRTAICTESPNHSTCNSGPLDVEDSNTKFHHAFQRLLCRNDEYLVFKLVNDDTVTVKYFVEIAKQNETKWTYTLRGLLTNATTFTVEDLSPGTKYKIRTWIVTDSSRILQPLVSQWIDTRSKDEVPLPVEKIWVEKYPRESDVDALVQWTPGKDLSCFYSYVYHLGFNIFDGIVDKKSLFKFTMTRLQYDRHYSVGIRAISQDMKKESKLVRFNFQTPNCLYIHKNLSMCTPDMPKDISVDEKLIQTSENYSIFNLNISWSKPDYTPDYYQLHFDSLGEHELDINITGEITNTILEEVKIKHFYQMSITAWSQKGSSNPLIYNGEVKHSPFKQRESNLNYVVIFFGLGVIIILFTVLAAKLLWSRYTRRRRSPDEMHYYFKNLDQHKNPCYVDHLDMKNYLGDELELKPKDILVQAVVGQGAFGIVRHGWLKKNYRQMEVAVKMLKNSPSFEELRQFQQELEIMKTVGSHPHLVSLIGFCMKEPHGPVLVVEYCSQGDLQSYLKNIWNKIINNAVPRTENVDVTNAVSNRVYDMDPIKCENDIIEPKELLSYARQIAMGMEYLANMKILHRDLAARNVLVCQDKTVKISDFGLSRDVYTDNVYRKTAGGMLPVRWMAIECLTHQQYTTQSDVWSYGILLWEIVNLGGNPYPGVSTDQLLKLLKGGYRMECPNNCGNEIYDIMNSCWRTCPKERPTFTELKRSIERLMENETDYLHIDLNTCVEMNQNSTHANGFKECKIPKIVNDRYVKPSWNINK